MGYSGANGSLGKPFRNSRLVKIDSSLSTPAAALPELIEQRVNNLGILRRNVVDIPLIVRFSKQSNVRMHQFFVEQGFRRRHKCPMKTANAELPI